MLSSCRWGRHNFWTALIILVILSLPLPGRAGDSGPLPATEWNSKNLSQIRIPAAEPLTFAVLGDNREHPEILGQILKEIDSDPGLAFAIHLGDMVKEGDLGHYRGFFTAVRQNLHKPLLAVLGNHELKERGLQLYRRIFGPDYYSFQKKDYYFIIVNDAAGKLDQEQLCWLEAELQKSQGAKTRMVFLHIPLYDPRGGDHHHCLPSEQASRLLDLFKKYRVSHIFAAHIHSYYNGIWDGMPYTITGGAGAPLYGDDPRHDFYHYLKVAMDGKQIQIQVQPWTTAGRH